MTVPEIVEQIRLFAHDRTLKQEYIYSCINMALQDVEGRGYYNYQYVKEDITVQAGQQNINTTYPILKLIEISPDVDLETYSGGIRLPKPATETTTYTIKYFRKHPYFDGAEVNKIIPDDFIYIIGGTYYAVVYLMSPEAPLWAQKFKAQIEKFYRENAFILPIETRAVEGVVV